MVHGRGRGSDLAGVDSRNHVLDFLVINVAARRLRQADMVACIDTVPQRPVCVDRG